MISSQKNTNRAKFIILRCEAVFDERIFLKTKKTRITHTDVFGCGFDAVFGEIIRQKQKYPYKPASKVTTPILFCCNFGYLINLSCRRFSSFGKLTFNLCPVLLVVLDEQNDEHIKCFADNGC